jgi:4-hydroxybenzoate polyprenyltransferase
MLLALLQSMRPRQWPKNAVIFAALVFDRKLTILPAFLHTLAGFFIFCLLSSVVYIINDIADVEADRRHPVKRNRPIASGRLPIPVALGFAIGLIIVIIPVSYLLSPSFALVALTYLLINLAYSKWIKHIPLLDVFTIALGFLLRVVAGVTLIQVERFSPWLYVVVTLGSLWDWKTRRLSVLGSAQSLPVLEGYMIPLLTNTSRSFGHHDYRL